jgi:hypothetical protein
MDGDLTRSKSNKGSLDGQFSHEFLQSTSREMAIRRALRGLGCFRSDLSGYGKTIFFTRELRCLLAWDKPVCLVYLVCFVCLVDLVHLVSFVQPKNQTNQIDQMNKAGWRAFSASCYSGTRISIQGGLSSTMSENRLAVLLAGIPGKTAPRRI